jgi:phage gpG-like protein
MSMVSIKVDSRAAEAKLKTLVPKARAGAATAVTDNTAKLLDTVRRKLSGEMLQARSGRLRDSIRSEIVSSAAGASGRVFSDAPYARIQEYGGRIEIPAIAPVSARALAFEYAGRLVFAAHARAHGVEIPEHGFMRSALAEIAPLFRNDLAAI